jgi:hypothetical protein
LEAIDVFPVRYEYLLHIDIKVIFVTGCGDLYVCETSRLPRLVENIPIDGSEVVTHTLYKEERYAH